ncbi:S-layer homology domain-containing protein [Ruminiclostridium herbifermentans]|uniref:S-layer homology domain-containing protein n=1 Tax=Ruminiclostridium herbifermentans TaxID=2488810 RepID=A0A4U7JCN4_9FIRM|nr:S-layer homology domain-containing protein [Ruminiclostridium herbifermentans]QNU68140.1 S-layer homology domain-containing protein [Ruminiclostridium herbifermentans]
MGLKKCILILTILFGFQSNTYAYESIAYLFAGNTTTYIKNVERTGANIKTVCPDYFEINSDGTLKNTIKVDPLFVQTMHAKNIKVTPYLSNNWDRTLGRAAVANRTKFVTQLAKKVIDLQCDGVNIDIQNLTEIDRDNFTDFMRLLRAALPSSKIISVCVAPNPWGSKTGWQGSYDYAALGSLSDQVFIMAYDEHYSGGAAGAVASLPFVEKSVAFALKHIPPSKIILGIPFYGRYWKQGSQTGGYGITVADVERLVSTYKAKTWYDESAQCARATLTISNTDNAIIWGSNKLSAGVYDIWYENETSIEKKLSLVSKYGLLGAGSWALGQEPDHFWKNYSVWLIGKPFIDIEDNWAQSFILEIYEKKIISGLPGNRFDPNGNLTRAQAAVMLVKMLELENQSIAGIKPFSDTVGHWGEKYITIAKKYGIFQGYGDNLFYPNKKITREEFSVICDKVLFNPDTVDFSQKIYSDVSHENNIWSNKSIIVLSMNNILSGYPDGTFRPKNTITRAETVRVISAMLDYPGGFTISPTNVQSPTPVEPR